MEIQEAASQIVNYLEGKGVTAVAEADPGRDSIKILMQAPPCVGRDLIAGMYFELRIPFGLQIEYSPEGPCVRPNKPEECPVVHSIAQAIQNRP